MSILDEAVKKFKADLEWRGHNGKAMGHVVLPRELAQALLPYIDKVDYQARVHEWIKSCFGPDKWRDTRERCQRFIEECLELAQSAGMPAADALALVEYVYGRPMGQPYQEAGGVMITFAGVCNAMNLHLQNAGEDELKRCWANIDKIRQKQLAKADLFGPLP